MYPLQGEFGHQAVDESGWQSPLYSTQVAIIPDLQMATVEGLSLKPKFLFELEEFLGSELDSLGVTAIKPNETRLQVSRLY